MEGVVFKEKERTDRVETKWRGKCTFQMSPCLATLYAQRKNGVK